MGVRFGQKRSEQTPYAFTITLCGCCWVMMLSSLYSPVNHTINSCERYVCLACLTRRLPHPCLLP